MASDAFLNDPQTEKRFLVIAYPINPATLATVPVYFSTHPFRTGPSDTPPSVPFEPRIKAMPAMKRSLFSEKKLSGRSQTNTGTLTLANDDGGLDGLEPLVWTAARADLFIGGETADSSDYGYLLTMSVERFEMGVDEIAIDMRDPGLIFDKEIQTARFAGTGGVEGTTDLQAQRKPDVWGLARGVPPVYLGVDGNGRHRFAVGSGPIVGVGGVSDRGAPLTYAATPAAGQYSVDLATGTIALGGAFNGPINADVLGRRYLSVPSTTPVTVSTGLKGFAVATGAGSPQRGLSVGMRVRCLSTSDPAGTWLDGVVTTYQGSARPGPSLYVQVDTASGSGTVSDWIICPWGTAAGILYAMADALGVGTAFDEPARVALNSLQPSTAGLWVPQGGNGLQLLDAVADATGCYWGTTFYGLFQAGRLDPPDPALSVLTYDSTRILSIEPSPTDDPAFEADIQFQRLWQVLSLDQVAGVADARKTYLSNEWRQVRAVNSAMATLYPLSPAISIDSIFDQMGSLQSPLSDAAAEAVRQLNLFSVRRRYYKVKVKDRPLQIPIGSVITIVYPRYGLSAGAAFRLIDISADLATSEIEMGLWG